MDVTRIRLFEIVHMTVSSGVLLTPMDMVAVNGKSE